MVFSGGWYEDHLVSMDCPPWFGCFDVWACSDCPADCACCRLRPFRSNFSMRRRCLSRTPAQIAGYFRILSAAIPTGRTTCFMANVVSWGRYQVVASPAEADLVFELRLMAPNGPANADKQKGASDPLPMLRLVIYDRPTHYVLWALTESIAPAALQKTHDHNFDEAVGSVVLDAGRLTKSLPNGMH